MILLILWTVKLTIRIIGSGLLYILSSDSSCLGCTRRAYYVFNFLHVQWLLFARDEEEPCCWKNAFSAGMSQVISFQIFIVAMSLQYTSLNFDSLYILSDYVSEILKHKLDENEVDDVKGQHGVW